MPAVPEHSEVAFKFTGDGKGVLDLRRAHEDAEHIRYLASPILAFPAGRAFVVCLAQASKQIFVQIAYGLVVNAVVDGLV